MKGNPMNLHYPLGFPVFRQGPNYLRFSSAGKLSKPRSRSFRKRNTHRVQAMWLKREEILRFNKRNTSILPVFDELKAS